MISVLFGIIHLVLVIVLELASRVVGLGISFFLILTIACLLLKNYMNAGAMAVFMGIGYLVIAAIAFIMFLAELVRDYFKDLSRIKLFR